jgi:hypothetical protein
LLKEIGAGLARASCSICDLNGDALFSYRPLEGEIKRSGNRSFLGKDQLLARISAATTKPSAPLHRLQAFEGQALGILDTGEIEAADENRHLLAITAGQGHDGVNGNPLGVHGLPRVVSSRDGPA